jgi:hypothetical protein
LVSPDTGAVSEVGITSGTPHGIRVISVWFAVIGASAEFGYVFEVWDFRPAGLQHTSRVFGEFTEGHRAPACPLGCEREAADSTEQIEHLELDGRTKRRT